MKHIPNKIMNPILTWNTSQWKSCRFFSLWISSWIGILRGRNYSEACHPQFRPEIWVSHKISWNHMNPPKFPIDSHEIPIRSHHQCFRVRSSLSLRQCLGQRSRGSAGQVIFVWREGGDQHAIFIHILWIINYFMIVYDILRHFIGMLW